MRSFAEMLADAGNHVVGMDQCSCVFFRNRHASAGTVDVVPWQTSPDWNQWQTPHVVYSLAVSPSDPVLTDARRNGLTVRSLPQALSGFLCRTRQICVAGTHGKTTTSAMLWWILNEAGKQPAGFVGGELCGDTSAGVFGRGEVAVVESCEYRKTFLELNPRTIVLTGIESDHFDCFPSDSDADDAFQEFLQRIPASGTIIVSADSRRALRIARSVERPFATYGLHGNGDWNVVPSPMLVRDRGVRALTTDRAKTRSYILRCGGCPVAEFTVPVPGDHNVSNAVAAILAAQAEGVAVQQAAELISTFPGVRRRFEHRGTWKGIDMIDDYAHHPTAVAATLGTARAAYPGRRILAIFEPHQICRTERLFEEFAAALALADESMILPVLPARESASVAACARLSGLLVRRITHSGGRAFLLADLDQVQGRLDHSGRPGDVVVTMGAGRTHLIHDEIHRRLRRDSAA